MNIFGNTVLPALAVAATLLTGCETSTASEEKKNDTPSAIKAGASFTHDGFKANKGWKVTNERFMGPSIKGLKVTNTGDDSRLAQFTFRFYKGKEVLAEVECSSNEMQGKETSPMDCFSTSSKFPKGYDAIKVSDMW